MLRLFARRAWKSNRYCRPHRLADQVWTQNLLFAPAPPAQVQQRKPRHVARGYSNAPVLRIRIFRGRAVLESNCRPQQFTVQHLVGRRIIHPVEQCPHQQPHRIVVVGERLAGLVRQPVARQMVQQVAERDLAILVSQLGIQLANLRHPVHHARIQRRNPPGLDRLVDQVAVDRLDRRSRIQRGPDVAPGKDHFPAMDDAPDAPQLARHRLQPRRRKPRRLRRLPCPLLAGHHLRPPPPTAGGQQHAHRQPTRLSCPEPASHRPASVRACNSSRITSLTLIRPFLAERRPVLSVVNVLPDHHQVLFRNRHHDKAPAIARSHKRSRRRVRQQPLPVRRLMVEPPVVAQATQMVL
jgi:hypothetical protein